MQVGFFFEILDEQAVCLGEHLPVHKPQFIAGQIGPVLGELHVEPLVGAAVLALQQPLGQGLRPQVQTGQQQKLLQKRGRVRQAKADGVYSIASTSSSRRASITRRTRADPTFTRRGLPMAFRRVFRRITKPIRALVPSQSF